MTISAMLSGERAINLCDIGSLQKFAPILFMCLIQPILTREIVQVEARDRLDNIGVRVNPHISQDRWEAIIELIRRPSQRLSKGIHKNYFRMYEKRKGRGWVRV